MTPRVSAGFVVFGVVATAALDYLSADGPQSAGRRVRTVSYESRPIAEVLRPDDDIVVVERPGFGGTLSDIDTKSEALLAAAGDYASIAIINVSGVSSVLTDRGAFIRTQFVGTVSEVLSEGERLDTNHRVSKDQAVEFATAGGEVAIRGVVVRMWPVVDYPYPARYLVVLGQRGRENGWATSLSGPLLLEKDKATAVAPAVSLLDGVTLDQIRSAVRKRRQE